MNGGIKNPIYYSEEKNVLLLIDNLTINNTSEETFRLLDKEKRDMVVKLIEEENDFILLVYRAGCSAQFIINYDVSAKEQSKEHFYMIRERILKFHNGFLPRTTSYMCKDGVRRKM
jgi:predicted GNAT superfamily acetyltransferase